MGLVIFQALGRNGASNRLWVESRRHEALGFGAGVPFSIESLSERLVLRPAILANNHVSSRAIPDGRRPIIDLSNQSILGNLAEYTELKIIASFERIEVEPSRRAFAIRRSHEVAPPFRVLDAFAGGGTLSAAVVADPRYKVVGGIEIEPNYADHWQAAHPEAVLVQCDIRAVESAHLPQFDILVAGIPCTSHSNLGRAKKGLAGQPELGDTGDLFLSVLGLVRDRMPAAVVLENVPHFGTSLAGELTVLTLRRLGYEVVVNVLRPNSEWGEIEDRQRWVLIATLDRPLVLRVPGIRCGATVAEFLDAPDAATDQADAKRIAGTLRGLRSHAERHRALGHGFGFTVLDGTETRIPVIPKSYAKINTGPFVETPFGPRLLRQAELERIRGCAVATRHHATAAEILGQGVQARVFREILRQLANHLDPRISEASTAPGSCSHV